MYKNSVCWFLWAAHQVDYPPSPTSELQGQILYRAQHALVVLLPEAIWFKPGNNSRGKEWAGDPSDVQLKPTSARSRPNKRLSPGNTVCAPMLITVSMHTRWEAHMLYCTVRRYVCTVPRLQQWNGACFLLCASKWQCLVQQQWGRDRCLLLVGMLLNTLE